MICPLLFQAEADSLLTATAEKRAEADDKELQAQTQQQQAQSLTQQASDLLAQADNETQQANADQQQADHYTALGQNGHIGQQRSFVYNLQGQLIAEQDADGQVLKAYVYLGTKLIALIEESGIYSIHADHLNTPRVITNSNQQVVWR